MDSLASLDSVTRQRVQACAADAPALRRTAPPTTPNPSSIRPQVAGSGTSARFVSLKPSIFPSAFVKSAPISQILPQRTLVLMLRVLLLPVLSGEKDV